MSTTTILILVAVVVVVAIAALVLRKKAPEALPKDDQAPTPRPHADAPREPRPAERAKAEPEPAAEAAPKASATTDTTEPEAEPSAAEAPAPRERETTQEIRPEQIEEEIAAVQAPAKAAPAKAAPPARASADDIAAYRDGLARTRGGFMARLARLFGKKESLDPAVLDEMEEILLTADIGVSTAEKLLAGLRAKVEAGAVPSGDAAWSELREAATAILTAHGGGPVRLAQTPTVILVVGVNGVGKTTTIGKLASTYREAGKKVLLAAGDTFRAAAVLQLDVWGKRSGAEVVKGKDRADPSAVIFDAVKKGVETGVDVVICDTAGRLHTKTPLMQELEKVGRTVEKALGRPADEVLLVLDATTGQNAIQQAQIFKEALPVSGIVLSKLDGSAKGGVILGIVDQHQVPVRYVGLGERIEDLKEFEASGFVEALFTKSEETDSDAS
ncbi:MAG: signal recognition particle-docking protein FtsY [Myxococcales bacterium]|nr:signal recognition particle-docking protein FtsY [Myxococcales bacterium]